jgi:very-short-patch-repair endonuclease
MNIDDWLKIHKANFGSSFEQMFVINVLTKVNDIDLNTVTTQYQFKDLDGKNRYCDFVIQEGSIKIAIEIDGYDKRNTGQGMSHDDFVDWQRRQAALTAYGWHVLRFANRDVSNEPSRCIRYIELLLRDQRNKSQHQASLEEDIERLSYRLKISESKAGDAEQAGKLQREISILKNQLKLAQDAKPLTFSDKNELEKMVARLEQEKQKLKIAHDQIKEEKEHLTASNTQLESQKQVLGGENNTMKTTIWAFATIISILILAGVYVFSVANNAQQANPNNAQSITPIDANTSTPKAQIQASQPAPKVSQQVYSQAKSSPASTSAPSSDSSIDWRLAKKYVGQRVTVRGIVAEYRYLMNGKGRPTWISLGAKYPVENRLSVVVWGDDRSKFGRALSENLVNRQICVTGVIKLYDGTPQITLELPQDLVLY